METMASHIVGLTIASLSIAGLVVIYCLLKSQQNFKKYKNENDL